MPSPLLLLLSARMEGAVRTFFPCLNAPVCPTNRGQAGGRGNIVSRLEMHTEVNLLALFPSSSQPQRCLFAPNVYQTNVSNRSFHRENYGPTHTFWDIVSRTSVLFLQRTAGHSPSSWVKLTLWMGLCTTHPERRRLSAIRLASACLCTGVCSRRIWCCKSGWRGWPHYQGQWTTSMPVFLLSQMAAEASKRSSKFISTTARRDKWNLVQAGLTETRQPAGSVWLSIYDCRRRQ